MARYEDIYMLIILSLFVPGHVGYTDYSGTEFIFAFTEHYSTTTENLFFTIVNTNPFSVTINANTPSINFGGVSKTETINAYDILKIEVNPNKVELQGSGIEQKSIKVTSTGNVIVIVFNRKKWSHDAYMVVPVHSTGTNYAAVTYCQDKKLCQIGIMAHKDNTNVQFTIPNTANTISVSFNGKQYNNGDIINVALNQYETVQLQSSTDLTGVSVSANYPVTATSGATRTSFNGGQLEHFVDALVPNVHLGREHILYASHSNSIQDIVKIVAIHENTSFTISGSNFCNELSIVKKGDMLIYSMTSEYIYIYSKFPIVVAHFTADAGNNGAMYFSTPIEKFNSEYFFYTPVDSFFTDKTFKYTNYVTVIVPKDSTNGLLLDETTLPPTTIWVDINRTNFVVATIQLTEKPGKGHRLRHQNNITFGGYLYGEGDAENYAFPLGYVFDTNYTECDYSTWSNCGTGSVVDVSCVAPETATSTESTVQSTSSPTESTNEGTTNSNDDTTSVQTSISSSVQSTQGYDTTTIEKVTTTTTEQPTTNIQNTCLCPCHLTTMSTLSSAEILQSIEKIKKELTIDPKTTSAAIRKKISVQDPRPSAKAVGASGIVILVIVFGGLILLDLTTLKREIEFFLSNVRN